MKNVRVPLKIPLLRPARPALRMKSPWPWMENLEMAGWKLVTNRSRQLRDRLVTSLRNLP